MPTLTINGRPVSVDDSFLNLPREEQDATVEEIAKSMPAQEPSGAYAGAKRGLAQLAHGVAETAKQNFGIGDGFDKRDPNYVPADPYKPSQWGQLITENIPSMGTAILGGKVAAAMAPGKFKIPAALLGATGAGWLMSSGDTIKDRAANNGHEDPSTSDKVIGNLTSGAGAVASAVPAARLVPGLNRVTGAGTSAAGSALAKALTTVGSGIAGGAASDLATQVGTTAGTDQGLTVDPSRVGGAAITGGVTSGALASPGVAGDFIRAGTLRKYVGDNEAASKNYATRLEAAGNGDLGKAKVDADAHNRVLGDLKTELADAAGKVRQQVKLSPEAENTLSALQKGTKVNPDEIARLDRETAGAPDGANTALLSRTLHVADMVGDRGSRTDKGWAGGLSGKLDKSVDFYLNPLRVAGGIGATAAGLHVFGLFNPKLVGSIALGYGAARMADNLTGLRSPAKTFAEHFADRNAQLRVPTAPQPPAAAPPAPGGQAQGPWGPKPLPQTAVPQVAPPAATAGPDPLIAATMARISLMQQPQAPAPQPQAPQIDPLNLPTSITKAAKNIMGGAAAVKEMREKEQARTAVARLPSPLVAEAPLDITQNPMVGKRAAQLVSAAKALQKYTGADVAEREQAQAAREEKAAAKAAEREKTATERALAMAERAKVKAEAARVKAPKAAPEAPPAADVPYEPLSEEYLYPKGISPKEYAMREAAKNNVRSEKYIAKAEASERRRQGIAREIKAKHPDAARAVDWVVRELQRVGTNPKEIARTVRYAQENVADDVAKALEAFK